MRKERELTYLFLWEERTLFLGSHFDGAAMNQASSIFFTSLEGPVSLILPGTEKHLSVQSFLLPAGTQYEVIKGEQACAMCMLDPLCVDYHRLKPLMERGIDDTGVFVSEAAQNHFQLGFEHIRSLGGDSEKSYQYLDFLLRPYTSSYSEKAPDQRVLQAIQFLKAHHNENSSLKDVADAVGLSPTRLSSLFKQQTGVNIRRYRSWYRLFRVVQEASQTGNIIAASVHAGFSDTSHFNNTFKSMIGVSPTELLKNAQNLKIVVSHETKPQDPHVAQEISTEREGELN